VSDGLDDTLKAIDGLGALASHEVSVKALKAVAGPIAADMRASIARDSGLTAEDITVAESKESGDEAVVLIGGTTGKRGRAYIMRFLEFGTVKTRAQPFMRPAWDRARGSYFSRLTDEYRKAFRSVVRRYSKAAA
jgi:HK97 gp10 family phage protein